MARGSTGAPASVAPPAEPEGTRDRLLAAAVTAFSERGFHGTTTRHIAAAAGMSPAAVYVHYRSKEELLYVISRRGHEHTLDLVRAALASSDDPAEQVRRLVRDFATDHARTHTGARVVNYELAALADDHLAEISGLRSEIQREVLGLVQRGVELGAFDTDDPAMTTTALLSLGIDIARWYRDDLAWTPEAIGDFYAELALRLVGARPG